MSPPKNHSTSWTSAALFPTVHLRLLDPSLPSPQYLCTLPARPIISSQFSTSSGPASGPYLLLAQASLGICPPHPDPVCPRTQKHTPLPWLLRAPFGRRSQFGIFCCMQNKITDFSAHSQGSPGSPFPPQFPQTCPLQVMTRGAEPWPSPLRGSFSLESLPFSSCACAHPRAPVQGSLLLSSTPLLALAPFTSPPTRSLPTGLFAPQGP